MTVTSTSLSPAMAANTSTTGATRTPKKALGQDDFLQLLTTQLQAQDPLKPMDDTSFIAQMAQFSSLQQMTQLQAGQSQLTAASYIGRNVTVKDATSGATFTGIATAVDFSGAAPAVIINGTSYPLSTVQRIEAAPAAGAPAPATAAPAAASTTPATTTTPASTATPVV